MAKKRYKEITFDEYDLPHIELLAGEKYSMSDLHMLIVLMELETNRRLTPHAPDKSGDSVTQAEPAKSSNPPVESAPL